MKNGRMDRISWTWTLDDATALRDVTQYPSENEKGARGGWEAAVSDQRPQGEGARDRAEMREIEKENSEGGGLHYRDV